MTQNGNETYGKIHISEEVLAVIAGIAANEIDGIASMNGGWTGEITEIFGMKKLNKGVQISIDEVENKINVDLYVVMKYGIRIGDTSIEIQKHVKSVLESMTNMFVDFVNVHVQGIKMVDSSEINVVK